MRTTFLQPLRTVALLALLWVLPQSHTSAQEFEVDGIWYSVLSESEVKSIPTPGYENLWETPCYGGDTIQIPETVTYEDVVYTVTTIGRGTFNGEYMMIFSGTSTIILPHTITKIESEAFYARHAPFLKFIQCMATTPPECAEGALDMGAVPTIYVPEGAKEAYQKAGGWKDFYIMEGEMIPDFTVDEIGFHVQTDTTVVVSWAQMKELYIPEIVSDGIREYKVTAIMPHMNCDVAFCYNSPYEKVVIPSTIRSLGDCCFWGAYELHTIVMRSKTPLPFNRALEPNKSIALYVPKGSLQAYQEADDWKEFTIVEGEPVPDFTVDGLTYRIKPGTNSVSIVACNDMSAFVGNVVIPEKINYGEEEFAVAEIANDVFSNISGLTGITLPSSMKRIGNDNFSYCWDLKYVQISANEPPICGEYAFSGITDRVLLYVPEGYSVNYQSAEIWKDFTTVIEGEAVPDFSIDGITYRATSGTNVCIISCDNAAELDGNLIIADSVCYRERRFAVTSIEAHTFSIAWNITGLVLPSTLASVGEYAFAGCSSLQYVQIEAQNPPACHSNTFNASISENTILYIPKQTSEVYKLADGWNGFAQYVEGVYIPDFTVDNLTYHITPGADKASLIACDDVSVLSGDIFIPDTVSNGKYKFVVLEIKDGVFRDAKDITGLILPSTIESIGNYAFAGCTGLQYIQVMATVPPSCSTEAFYGVDVILYVPKGTYEAYKEAEGWSSFSNIIDGEPIPDFTVNGLTYHQLSKTTVSLIDGTSANGDVSIPETVQYNDVYYTVTEIGDTAFYQCANMISVTIPKSVTNVASEAFYECTGLKYVEIADGDTPLSFKDNYQFWTSPLDSAYIGRDLEYGSATKYGGNSPFVGRTSAFYTPIKKVIFGDSVTVVGKSLFRYSVSLESVILGENVTEIESSAFGGCTSLKTVVCNAVTPPTCRNTEFRNTSATLYVPEGTLEAYQTARGWNVFAKIIDSPYVPDFVVDGIKYTLLGKGQVGVVAINEVTKYEGDIVLPETVTFEGVTYTLTTICSGAFYQCNDLKSVSIPATVTAIEEEAFYSCSPRIECKAMIPPTCTRYSFSNVSSKVYIPEGTLELYQDATGWKDFSYLIDVAYVPDFTFDGVRYTQVSKGKVGVDALVLWETDIDILLPETVEHEGVVYHLTEICEGAFSDRHLSSIAIPEGLTAIRDYAFYNCYQLKSIKLPDSLTTLGASAFAGCSQLRKVTIPEGVTSIEYSTFEWCPIDTMIVKSMTPPNVKSSNALGGAYQSVGVLVVPTGALQAYMTARSWREFYKIEEESGYSNVFEVDGVHYKMYSVEDSVVTVVGASASEIIIPDSVVYDKKYAVKVIGNGAFSGNTELESVVISEGVTTLGSSAFANCSNLRSISIPSTLVNGNFSYQYREYNRNYSPAFYGCTGLENITVAEGHPNLDSRNDCNALIWTNEGWNGVELMMGCKNTVIPDGVTQIAPYAFGDTGIEKVAIPNSVTRIGTQAFQGCGSLTTLQIGSGLTEFSYPAIYDDLGTSVRQSFTGCYNLRTIVIDEANPLVDSRGNCNAIIETATNTILLGCNGTTIPEGVTAVLPNAFSQCHYLESLYVPASLTSIPLGSFNGCRSLKSIVVDEANTAYDSRNNCNAIIETATDTLIRGCMNTVIPEDVVCIGHYAFAECLGLEEILIPDAVHTIGSNAFQLCNYLRTITFGSGLKSIGSLPFGDIYWDFQMFSLNSIVFKGSVPPVFEDQSGFSSLMHSYVQLVVPGGSLSAYQSADVWKDFAHITEGEGAVEFEYDGICYRIILGNDSAMVRPRLDKESATMESTYPDSIVIPETVWYDNKEYVVNAIGEYAFYDCKLNYLSIPATVERVGYNGLSTAFTGTVICYAAIPPLCLESYIWSVSNDAVLRVPKESIELYEQAVFWQHFFRWANVEAIEDVTGIESAEADVPYMHTDAVYDLSGRRIADVENLKSGIYIVNGKKVVIK